MCPTSPKVQLICIVQAGDKGKVKTKLMWHFSITKRIDCLTQGIIFSVSEESNVLEILLVSLPVQSLTSAINVPCEYSSIPFS